MMNITHASGGRTWLWLGVLVAASVAFSLGFACAVPLAAFGAMAGLTLSWRHGLVLMGAVWLANQIVGFGMLAYPMTAQAFIWSPILAASGFGALLAARAITATLRYRPALAWLMGFGAAFVAYEGGLYVVSALAMGGTEFYTAAIVGRVAALNGAAFAGLYALDRLVRARPIALLPPGAARA